MSSPGSSSRATEPAPNAFNLLMSARGTKSASSKKQKVTADDPPCTKLVHVEMYLSYLLIAYDIGRAAAPCYAGETRSFEQAAEFIESQRLKDHLDDNKQTGVLRLDLFCNAFGSHCLVAVPIRLISCDKLSSVGFERLSMEKYKTHIREKRLGEAEKYKPENRLYYDPAHNVDHIDLVGSNPRHQGRYGLPKFSYKLNIKPAASRGTAMAMRMDPRWEMINKAQNWIIPRVCKRLDELVKCCSIDERPIRAATIVEEITGEYYERTKAAPAPPIRPASPSMPGYTPPSAEDIAPVTTLVVAPPSSSMLLSVVLKSAEVLVNEQDERVVRNHIASRQSLSKAGATISTQDAWSVLKEIKERVSLFHDDYAEHNGGLRHFMRYLTTTYNPESGYSKEKTTADLRPGVEFLSDLNGLRARICDVNGALGKLGSMKRRPKKGEARENNGMSRCNNCGHELPVSSFDVSSRSNTGELQVRCINCPRDEKDSWYATRDLMVKQSREEATRVGYAPTEGGVTTLVCTNCRSAKDAKQFFPDDTPWPPDKSARPVTKCKHCAGVVRDAGRAKRATK